MKKSRLKVICGVLLVSVALGSVTGTYAAYTSIKSAKRVISTIESASIMFSSNYLKYMQQKNMGTIDNYNVVSAEPNAGSVYVSVCNYPQGYMTTWAEGDIAYTITFTLVDKEGNIISSDQNYEFTDENGTVHTVSGSDILAGTYSIQPGSGTIYQFINGKATYQSALSADKANRLIYKLGLDDNYYDFVNVWVKVLTDNDTQAYAEGGLGGIITPIVGEKAVQTSWSGRFIDYDMTSETDYAANPANLSGFNYEISGTGAAEYRLTWNSEKLNISTIFLNSISYVENAAPGGQKSITFSVGADGETESYRIQFYRNEPAAAGENWNLVESYIIESGIVTE